MIVFRKKASLQKYLLKRGSIGFVPTMGALHEGHLSLVDAAKDQGELVVCSIYVNPTQFNESKDLESYPRTMAEDILKLLPRKCDVLFVPTDEEMYPKGLVQDPPLDISAFTKSMEGEHRPGHFEGMSQIVYRLLQAVNPDSIYMGQKDFQQYRVVQYMVNQLEMDVEVKACPIVREDSGLAMSSRNQRLSGEQKEAAARISWVLNTVKSNVKEMPQLSPHIEWAMEHLQTDHLKPEYFEIVNADTLERVTHMQDANDIIACTAVWAGDVRLIDNMRLK